MKILLIEDARLFADSLVTLLTSKGFQVESVYDGETGAGFAALGIYDLLGNPWLRLFTVTTQSNISVNSL